MFGARFAHARSLIAAVLLPLGLIGCGGDAPAGPGSGDDPAAGVPERVVVSAGGGTYALAGGAVMLTVPAGAVDRDTTLTLTAVAAHPDAPAPVAGTAFRLEPDGMRFAASLALRITYQPAALPPGCAARSLRVCRALGDQWQPLPSTVDSVSGTVETAIDGFSVYGVVPLASGAFWPGRVILERQADVERWTGYTGIGGTLTVTGTVTDLSPLGALESVGRLEVVDTDSLADLRGLGALRHTDWLTVRNNALLQTVNLPALGAVGDVCRINRNAALRAIEMPGLRVSGRDATSEFVLHDNPVLDDLSGLSALTEVTGSLQIGDCPALVSLHGLDGLQRVRGTLYVGRVGVRTLAGLGAVSRVSALRVYACAELDSLVGLTALAGVDGDLRIESNPRLSSLAGVGALGVIGGALAIDDNDALVDLEGLRVGTVEGGLLIWNNDGLTSLSGLAAIGSIGTLQVERCPGLHDLTGVGSWPVLHGLVISRNASLTSLSGLQALTQLAGAQIDHNLGLQNLEGLQNLTHVDGLLRLWNNYELNTLDHLASLQSVGGLDIWDCRFFPNLHGLAGLTRLGWTGHESVRYLRINNAGALIDVTGLYNLQVNPATNLVIQGDFTMMGNYNLNEQKIRDLIEAIGGEAKIGGEVTYD